VIRESIVNEPTVANERKKDMVSKRTIKKTKR
jgi:hypothetical protein